MSKHDFEEQVSWFNHGSSRLLSASLTYKNGIFHAVNEVGEEVSAAIKDLVISPRLGSTQRSITFPNGVSLLIANNDLIDKTLTSKTKGWHNYLIHRLERSWAKVILLGLCVVPFLFALAIYGIPLTAKLIAPFISLQQRSDLSVTILDYLLAESILTHSELHKDDRALVQKSFNHITNNYLAQDNHDQDYQLGFYSSPLANAFALPDGFIIVTDPLIKRLNKDEIIAVLAHEVGHVEHYHGILAIIKVLSINAISILISGGDISFALNSGINLINLKYSRDHEREADCFAYKYLRANGLPSSLLSDALGKITIKPKNKKDANTDSYSDYSKSIFELLTTHPSNEERKNLAVACQ